MPPESVLGVPAIGSAPTRAKVGRKPALKSILDGAYTSEHAERTRHANTLMFLAQVEHVSGLQGGADQPVQLVADIRYEPDLAAAVRNDPEFLAQSCGNYYMLRRHLELLEYAAYCFGKPFPSLTTSDITNLLDQARCSNKVPQARPLHLRLCVDLPDFKLTVQCKAAFPRLSLMTGLMKLSHPLMHSPYPRLVIDCLATLPSLHTMYSTGDSNKAILATERREAAIARLVAGYGPEQATNTPASSPIDVLLVNSLGELLGTPTACIAVLRRGIWLTPPLLDGARCDVVRQELLRRKCIAEGSLPASRVRRGEEIMLFSSTLGVIRGVVALDVPELALKRRDFKQTRKNNVPTQRVYSRMQHAKSAYIRPHPDEGKVLNGSRRSTAFPGSGVFRLAKPSRAQADDV